MGVGYLGVRWPSRDLKAIEVAKRVERRQLARESNAKQRVVEKKHNKRILIEKNKILDAQKRQEIAQYQYEENKKLERLAKLTERERQLAESCASRQKARLIEIKSQKAKSNHFLQKPRCGEDTRNIKQTTRHRKGTKTTRPKRQSPDVIKSENSDRSPPEMASLASTITTKATAAACMEVHAVSVDRGEEDEAEELFQSIKRTSKAADGQLKHPTLIQSPSLTPQQGRDKEGVTETLVRSKKPKSFSAYARVKQRLSEMDALLMKMKEREQQLEKHTHRLQAHTPKKGTTKKRERASHTSSWMRPTQSSVMRQTERPKQKSHVHRKKNEDQSDSTIRTTSVATRSLQSRERFEDYYQSKYESGNSMANSVKDTLRNQDEEALLNEAGAMLASSLLCPGESVSGGYTWGALSHAMGFTDSVGTFNTIVQNQVGEGLYLKVNSLRDALSLRFRPAMHHHDVIRPVHIETDPSEVVHAPGSTTSEVVHALVHTDGGEERRVDQGLTPQLKTAGSQRAWEELATMANTDNSSVRSHATTVS